MGVRIKIWGEVGETSMKLHKPIGFFWRLGFKQRWNFTDTFLNTTNLITVSSLLTNSLRANTFNSSVRPQRDENLRVPLETTNDSAPDLAQSKAACENLIQCENNSHLSIDRSNRHRKQIPTGVIYRLCSYANFLQKKVWLLWHQEHSLDLSATWIAFTCQKIFLPGDCNYVTTLIIYQVNTKTFYRCFNLVTKFKKFFTSGDQKAPSRLNWA